MNTIVARFQTIAQAHPEVTALVSDHEVLTYAQLQQRAMQIAAAIDQWFLDHCGRLTRSTDVIGICIEKCADLYAAIFGILASGASYVPLDPELSREVQQHIVQTCECQLIIASGAVLPVLREVGGVAFIAAETIPHSTPVVHTAGLIRPIGTDICYTIFTSGSTGRPKGVKITHVNLLNLVDWAVAEFALAPGVRALQYSTINFDASILDIFLSLLAGATLCIPSQAQRLSEAGLADFCQRHQVNHAFLPPSLLAILPAQRFPSVTTVLTGGEACSPQAVQDWLPGRRLYNLYGPTECTVLVSYKRVDGVTPQSNIGRAIPGVRLYVLDEQMAPAARGELHVAGLAVSPGYVGDALASEKKFLRLPALDASVLYKTGDIVERNAQGDLIFAGRVDRQVKVRGYRIELEEIEGALQKLGYAEVALKVSSQGALVAYLVSATTLDAAALRRQLDTVLSDFKIPQHFVQLERLPYKVSGKVDYQSLPEFIPAASAPVASAEAGKYAPIAQLWAQELALDADSLSPQANFRELGGTSLNIVRLLSSIETQFGVSIDFIDFLDNPTIHFIYHSVNAHE